jgi:hypothetical protein
MATFLDTLGILDFFAPLFSAVLVFAVVFALLAKTRVLGDSKVVQSIIAIILAILVLLVPDLVTLINFIAPWFVLMFIFFVLLLLMYQMFGLTEQNIATYMMQDRAINWGIFAVSLLIILAGVFFTFGERALEVTNPDVVDSEFQSNLFDIVFDPKILGLILVFTVAVFTIAFLGGGTTG